MSTPLRVIDAFDPLPPQSKFSDAERKAIMESARQTAKQPLPSHEPALPKPEDPVAKWKREADERIEREAIELEGERRELQEQQQQRERQQRQQQWRQHRSATQAWRTHLEQRFESERDFQAEVIGEIVAELTHQFEIKLKKLETENASLRAEVKGFATRLDALGGHRASESAAITTALLSSQREVGTLRKRIVLVEDELFKWRNPR
jgi:hypothetical protein